MEYESGFSFIYSDDASMISLESSEDERKLVAICMGLGREHGIPDFSWTFRLDDPLMQRIDSIVESCGLVSWEQQYESAEDSDIIWDVKVKARGIVAVQSWGKGERPELFYRLYGSVCDLLKELSSTVRCDVSELKLLEYRFIRDGFNCSCHLEEAGGSSVEMTRRGEKALKLTPEQWDAVKSLVEKSPMPRIGYERNPGSQYVSWTLCFDRGEIRYVLGGTVGKEWYDFEEKLLGILGLH